jgi:hypothetical protein
LEKMISLLEADFDVIASATDSRAALDAVRSHKPDVIILDLSLPWLNSIRIGEEVATLSPSPRIVICSTVTDRDVIEAARQAGASAYVFKTRIERELKLAVKAAARGIFFASPAATPKVLGKPQWELSGAYLESCNCEITCPRVSLAPPRALLCTALIGWQIESGNFDNTNLSGLNVAAAMYSPRNSSKWRLGMYIDERATPEQNEALGRIFTGEAGGHLVRLAKEVAVFLGVRIAPIEFRGKARHWSLQIPGIAEVEIEGVRGSGGAPITITNHPLGAAPGFPAKLGKSRRLSYSDYGLEWKETKASGFFARFHYENS